MFQPRTARWSFRASIVAGDVRRSRSYVERAKRDRLIARRRDRIKIAVSRPLRISLRVDKITKLQRLISARYSRTIVSKGVLCHFLFLFVPTSRVAHHRWTWSSSSSSLFDRWIVWTSISEFDPLTDPHRRRFCTWLDLLAARQPRSTSVVVLDALSRWWWWWWWWCMDLFSTDLLRILSRPWAPPSLSIPVSLRLLLSSLSLSLSRVLFVSPSLGFSLSGLPCAVSLHPTLTYPSTCLPRRCTPSLPSANPTHTITYTRTIFPIPTYRAPSLPSARVFFIYSAIPRSNATLRTRWNARLFRPRLFEIVVSRANLCTGLAAVFPTGLAPWPFVTFAADFVGHARRDRLVKSTRITTALLLLSLPHLPASPSFSRPLPFSSLSSPRSPPTPLPPPSPSPCLLYLLLFHRVRCLVLSD